ncbi:MarR family transcriptional regulator [Desulforamulus aeronauticus]|uniref:Transcriptional regulator, MarR family n=1 Tax=Desulforamulus aeronauticus DSM 10349 TaxID=1121421 RepID=A0A1M6Q1P2_9FIRM|nr:MarR family transcriptional regulator [Desulforamulus aeronauticus]SHK14130.1 transcriptional regulator, MarR family [Desulforamulus aeronauticus DSM 10349]
MKNNLGKFEIDVIINKLIYLSDYINDYSKIHEKSLQDLLAKYSPTKNLMLSEIHVIDCIGKNQLPNATFIAKELNMTKGAISKITSKLLKKQFIKANYLENNKKEIYYTLTTQGKEVFKVHEKLHDIENEKIINILTLYNKEELLTINKFLDDLLNEL